MSNRVNLYLTKLKRFFTRKKSHNLRSEPGVEMLNLNKTRRKSSSPHSSNSDKNNGQTLPSPDEKPINNIIDNESSTNYSQKNRQINTKKHMTKKQIYKERIKKSPCRGLLKSRCITSRFCKYASGIKRAFCRKKKNFRPI